MSPEPTSFPHPNWPISTSFRHNGSLPCHWKEGQFVSLPCISTQDLNEILLSICRKRGSDDTNGELSNPGKNESRGAILLLGEGNFSFSVALKLYLQQKFGLGADEELASSPMPQFHITFLESLDTCSHSFQQRISSTSLRNKQMAYVAMHLFRACHEGQQYLHPLKQSNNIDLMMHRTDKLTPDERKAMGLSPEQQIPMDTEELALRARRITELTSQLEEMQFSNFHFVSGIDATKYNLRENEFAISHLIWFQCPWINDEETSGLVKDFMVCSSEQQKSGDFLFLGIAGHVRYAKTYGLDSFKLSEWGYEFIGCNRECIHELLQLGYQHKGLKDIHEKIYSTHVTLCFRKV